MWRTVPLILMWGLHDALTCLIVTGGLLLWRDIRSCIVWEMEYVLEIEQYSSAWISHWSAVLEKAGCC